MCLDVLLKAKATSARDKDEEEEMFFILPFFPLLVGLQPMIPLDHDQLLHHSITAACTVSLG